MARPFCWLQQFWPVTLNFDLLLKKLCLAIIFWTEIDRAFILSMHIPCGKIFLSVPIFLISWPWPPTLTYFRKKLNLGINFLIERDGAFIFKHGYSLMQDLFARTNILIHDFDLLLKNLTLNRKILRDYKSWGDGISPVRTAPI